MLHNRVRISIAMSILVASFGLGNPVGAQGLFNDLGRYRNDQRQVRQDQKLLTKDLNNGNLGGAIGEMILLNQDQQRVNRDRGRIYRDLNGGYPYGGGYYPNGGSTYYPGSVTTQPTYTPTTYQEQLVPSPTSPGYYYYPSNPGQLYYYPTQQGVAPPSSVPTRTQPAATAPPTLRTNAPPVRKFTVKIVNPENTGVDINYAIDGVEYSIPSGKVQSYSIASGSTIAFSRGETEGEALYGLSEGAYEFKYTDSGWEVFRKPLNQANPRALTANAAPRQAPRRLADENVRQASADIAPAPPAPSGNP